MKYLNILESPIQITGLAAAHDEIFWRMTEDKIDSVTPSVSSLSKSTAGGCVRFSTDSKTVEVKVKLRAAGLMSHMPLSGQSGVDVYFDGLFAATIRPSVGEKEYSGVANRPVVLEDGVHKVECFLPLYNGITGMEVGINDEAEFSAPPAQKYAKPVCYYGSSITQGGCASKPGNCYTNVLARWLDFPQVNLGFSGNAKGEQSMAEYIASLDIGVLVLDYDHNAYALGHLAKTHKPFFDTIRKARPELPIIIVTRPDFDRNAEVNKQRRAVIYSTYMYAKNAGDDKVWFVDGEKLFDSHGHVADRLACTVDGCHPNDLGFHRMATTIYPVLKEVLESEA